MDLKKDVEAELTVTFGVATESYLTIAYILKL